LAVIMGMTNDPSPDETQLERARSQRSLGEALRAQGDLASALAADREALRIMSELTEKTPEDPFWQRDLSVSHSKVGLDLLAGGDAGSARDEIRAGLAIMTRLASLDTTNAEWQRDLGELHRANGDASRAASDDVSAHEEYEVCAGITEPMVSRGSTNKKLAELAVYCRSQSTAALSGQSRSGAGQASAP